MSTRPSTLGALRASGWASTSIKDEVRRNAVARIAAGRPVVDGVLGFDDTVLPALENALLAGHDVIFLGERGQAKTRVIRSLTALLDEWLPIVAGSEINDDPYRPVSRHARDLVAAEGEDTPITWVGRDQRFGEKLATPDTSVADLIGEVDPIRVAEGRYLSDELTLHYGLVPRTNRGIFAINELPDLAERIQVALLNVLEERDIQIRGHKIRLPLDVMLVASANPEDYTNRGRIITPLKDRFGAQVRTHYPRDIPTELAVVAQEAAPLAVSGLAVSVPSYMSEIVATLSQLARVDPAVNQRSGVSVRLTIANHETMVASAARRALRCGEPEVVPRISDLPAMRASTAGKVEIEMLDEGRDSEVLDRLVSAAVLATFRGRLAPDQLGAALACFDEGTVVRVSAELASATYVEALAAVPALAGVVRAVLAAEPIPAAEPTPAPAAADPTPTPAPAEPPPAPAAAPTPAALASATELVLEGLHLSRRLNKSVSPGGAGGAGQAVYRARDRGASSEEAGRGRGRGSQPGRGLGDGGPGRREPGDGGPGRRDPGGGGPGRRDPGGGRD
ncbi:MAG: AAA family ATPase [Acidimicrobiales bacterium]